MKTPSADSGSSERAGGYDLMSRGVKDLNQNDLVQSLSAFHEVSKMPGWEWTGRLHYHLSLPVVYERQEAVGLWRSRFLRGLNHIEHALSKCVDLSGAARALATKTNFYLAYQCCNDLLPQGQYGRIVQRVVESVFPPLDRGRRVTSGRPKVGFVSTHLRNHTVGKLAAGFILNRDPRLMEARAYLVGEASDEMTARLEKSADSFTRLPDDFRSVVEAVRSDSLDVAVFPEVGMYPTVLLAAAARLAPVQCAFWGHPVTTGLPNMDYFLTSEGMEPEGCASHYTETPVLLPGIGVCYDPEAASGSRALGRSLLGLAESETVYLSSQSLFKYLPRHDFVFPRIAAEAPDARIVFLLHPWSDGVNAAFADRLRRAFHSAGLDWRRHCRMMPHMNWHGYSSVLRSADVVLDSLDWSGGNTSLEALACGLPPVTVPGPLMRCRHTYAMLKQLRVEETVASSPDEYVKVAVELGRNPDMRQCLGKLVRERAPDSLFRQTDVNRSFETVVAELARR